MATEHATTRVPAMRRFDSVVYEVIVETPDTITAVLDVGEPVIYRAGQYVTIDPHQFPALGSMTRYLEHLKGRPEPPRAYSMFSAPHEDGVAITIKEELYDGQMAIRLLIRGSSHSSTSARSHVRGRLCRCLRAARSRRCRSHPSPLRRVRQRAKRVDDQGRSPASSRPATYVRVLEQDLAGRHFPEQPGEPPEREPGQAAGHSHAHA
jgi:hypothetical protein